MTAILSIQNNTIYFEGFIREQLKTQENEARAELKDREVEMQGMQKNLESIKAQKTMNDRIVEELRPLCEELPPDALDPVTMEPIDRCMVLRCGHSLNITTIVSLAKSNGLCQQDAMECPMCKVKTPLKQAYTCYSLDHCSRNFQRINKVFQSHV